MFKKIKNNLKMYVIICICCTVVLAVGFLGGQSYLHSLRSKLTNVATSNVLSTTDQQRQMLDTFFSNDRERLHSHAMYYSRLKSTDTEQISDMLDLFAEIAAAYTVINLDTGDLCNNKGPKYGRLEKDDLDTYRALAGSGVRSLFDSIYSDSTRFGYYETFTFADGVPGIYQKSYDTAKVSQEFSLSFYDGKGLGYVVDSKGDILLRSVDKQGQSSYENIFKMASEIYGNSEISSFEDDTLQDRGVTMFKGTKGSYIFAYSQLESVKGWYLVSLVPVSAVTKETNNVIMDSQFAVRILLIFLGFFVTIFLLILQNQKMLHKKDQRIRYQQQQFNIFSTFLSNNTNDVYIMLDSTAEKAEYVSPNVERILGVSLAAVQRDIRALGRAKYLGRDAVEFKELMEMKADSFMDDMTTQRFNPKTGEQKWFLETIYRTELDGENKFVLYISDRTQDRETQEALTEALHMAQAASQAKSSFLGNVSHDIRTPMNAIMGLIALLREDAGNPEQVLEYTKRIDAASQHLLGLINDVLDINKIESGSATLNITEMTLPEIVEELNTIIRPQAKAKHQDFEIFTSPFSCECLMGDKIRINQVLINILSNAVKYTLEGGRIELSISELPQDVAGCSHIQFVIRDNGMGMTDEYLEIIFDPFTREQNEKTHLIQGTGLGMAITKSLVDLMGGSIKVESKEGAGSTFTVELEFRTQETEDDPAFWADHKLSRMLVVDDEEVVCQTVIKTMSKTGVDVDYATSGEQAIQMIRQAQPERPYDLLLLDWRMPSMDGLETARQIQKDIGSIPIILFTAYDWSDIKDEAKGIGVEHFLAKPFFMFSFKEAIQRLMSQKQEDTQQEDTNDVIRGRHILVVDDIEVNRMILTKILSTLGATCDTAANGQDALEKFTASQPGRYDLIFMDVQMPIMDGYAATRAIRSSNHPSAKDIAIVAMTANAFADDVLEALEAGMDAHVSKPIVIDQLKATLHDVLSRKE